MNDNSEQFLRATFPNLYAKLTHFEVDEGWYNLIKELSHKLEDEIVKMPKEERENCYAVQVKEKFGGLRFYISAGTPVMYADIDDAESASFKTCEVCGRPGEPGGRFWIKTVCDKHLKEMLKDK
jgi:hypothetical protein